MKLGAFSISLAVKDLLVSKTFYEKLGFKVFAGELDHKYLIMKNQDTVIGLFEGMFDKNILTFNPGWDQACNTLEDYQDVRTLHRHIHEQGVATDQVSLEGDRGIGSFVIVDPDGNPILFDQHVE